MPRRDEEKEKTLARASGSSTRRHLPRREDPAPPPDLRSAVLRSALARRGIEEGPSREWARVVAVGWPVAIAVRRTALGS